MHSNKFKETFSMENAKLPVGFQDLDSDLDQKEVQELIDYIHTLDLDFLTMGQGTRGNHFYGSTFLRLPDRILYEDIIPQPTWDSFWRWAQLPKNPDRERIYEELKFKLRPAITSMCESLSKFTGRRHFPMGIEINIMPPNSRIETHIDKHPRVEETHRVHLVLETNPGARMFCGRESRHCPQGAVFIFNNKMSHAVINGDTDRSHLVVDFLTYR